VTLRNRFMGHEMKFIEEYRDSKLSRKIIDKINKVSQKEIRIMEVCGTHTVSIFRNGIRSVLPKTVSLISGPGCPVCVTSQSEVDAFIALAGEDDVIVATFGDLIRVPGTFSSLQREKAEGRNIRIVYSTFDALEIAKKNPDKKIVFLGVGFETTAPTIAASVISAKQAGIKNYFIYSAHKLVPPALETLMGITGGKIDGFLLPGHVSVIIGTNAYSSFFEQYQIPCAIAGFEPTDILQAIFILIEQHESGSVNLVNSYERAVCSDGNSKARQIMYEVFETCDASWRGIGTIPKSGLRLKKEYKSFDAMKKIKIIVPDSQPPKGCACGEVLTGKIIPPDCPFYKTICTPIDPVGPCMVSSEGTCAAYYKYHIL